MEDESLLLDPSMDYKLDPGLSSEVIEKLYRVRPTTIVRVSLQSLLNRYGVLCLIGVQ